jgi:hypothetical protein
MKNYLLHSLAIVGAISLIIMACSADNSASSTTTMGKYQISSYSTISAAGSANITRYFDVIDTETGVVKSYNYVNTSGYTLITTTTTQP